MHSAQREMGDLVRRHSAFWRCEPVERPLIYVIYDAYQDTELVAASVAAAELQPDMIDPAPILPVYDRIAAAREAIGDDMVATAEALLGIPWLEAMCGCRVLVPQGKSLWPEPTEATRRAERIVVAADNPWLQALLRVQRAVVDHAQGRYAVGMSHLRGPSDVLTAMLGSEGSLTLLYDDPQRVRQLALDVAAAWRQAAAAQEAIVPAYRGGYCIRQFGVWSPGRSVWLQDDASGMMSLRHYSELFLEPVRQMSAYAYGVLHLHSPSLHLALTLAEVPNIRATNVYFDSPTVTLQDAMPTLRALQKRRMPLILAKDVYQGFTLAEYAEILDGLSPHGLSVHLRAESVEEGRAVMDHVRARAASGGGTATRGANEQ